MVMSMSNRALPAPALWGQGTCPLWGLYAALGVQELQMTVNSGPLSLPACSLAYVGPRKSWAQAWLVKRVERFSVSAH